MPEPGDVWLRCSACKQDIRFRQNHWVCSVSTCNRRATRQQFCSVSCWDSHVATLRHRDAWAVEARAPGREEWQAEQAAAAAERAEEAATAPTPAAAPSGAPRRVIGAMSTSAPAPAAAPPHVGALSSTFERDMLIVVSKLKKYIKDRSGMNTADGVADFLSDHVRAICDDAIRAAGTDGRKTVMERDVPKIIRR